MNVTLSLESILQMLQPLSADNKRWLGEKLIEESHAEERLDRRKRGRRRSRQNIHLCRSQTNDGSKIPLAMQVTWNKKALTQLDAVVRYGIISPLS